MILFGDWLMLAVKPKTSQGLLFSEPLYTETGLWCELAQELDPAEWAGLCRQIGQLNPKQFRKARKNALPNPDSLINRFKRIFCFDQTEAAHLPLVCLGQMPAKDDTHE